MASKGIFSGVNRDSILDSVRTTFAAVAALLLARLLKTAGILLGADLDHRGRAIHDPAADAGLAALCGDSARGGAGRGAGYVLQSECVGLRCGDSFVRNAGVVIARGRRLPVCGNYAEYYFADSADARSVDHRVASVSGSVAGNCGGAGGDDSVAAGEESDVSGVRNRSSLRDLIILHPRLCFPSLPSPARHISPR